MISGEVLKYLKGFFIRERYEAHFTDSSHFPLTMPLLEVCEHLQILHPRYLWPLSPVVWLRFSFPRFPIGEQQYLVFI